MLKIGQNLKIHVIEESYSVMDPGGMFGLVPYALWKSTMTHSEERLIPVISTSLLIQTPHHNILIDTGIGSKVSSKQQLWMRLEHRRGTMAESLARLQLTPEDIDIVVNTHLHSDHSGGNTYTAEDGSIQATFPNAEYLVQKKEYEAASNPNERTRATYLTQNYVPLFEQGRLRLIEGDIEIAPGVTGVITPGHTPSHMIMRIEDGDDKLLYLADLASYAVHFERLAWIPAFDVEPLTTLETKRKWRELAFESQALVMFAHDILRPAARVVKDGDELALEIVEIDYV